MDALLDYAWLVALLPLVSAVAIAAFGKQLPARGAELGILSLGAAWLLAAGIAVQTYLSSPLAPLERSIDWSPLGGGFVLELGMLVDGLTAVMLLLVTTVSLMVHIYARSYMEGEPRYTYFFAMLSLFTFSMLVLVVANNLLLAVIGWELVGLCSYLLIGFYWEGRSNQNAANKAFLTTKFGDVGLIVGVIVLSAGMFQATDTPFNILQINEAAAAGELATGTVVVGMLLIFLGCVSKSGQMPLHVWLPDAMAGPTPVSALIHAATMVTAGVFLLARLYPVVAQSAVVMATIAIVGAITLFFGGLLAVVQDDLKKILAYSTISQLGYMIAAIGIGGYTASVFHLFTHGFFKALLFLGAGSLIHAVHSNNISDMGGMARAMPHTFWTFIVGSLALAGFPLTAGFFSKDEILVTANYWGEAGMATGTLVYWLGLAAAFVTTFYMARACFLVFAGKHRSHQHPHESPMAMTAPLMVLAVLSIAAGYLLSPFSPDRPNFETWVATPLLDEQATFAFTDVTILHGVPSWHPDLLAIVLGVFAIAVVLAYRAYGRGLPERDPMLSMGPVTTALVNRYGIDDAGYKLVVVPVRDHLSRWASHASNEWIDGAVAGVGRATKAAASGTYRVLDQRVIDGGVNGAAFSAAWWSERLKRMQSGDVQRYAAAIVAGVIVLLLAFAAMR